MLRAQTLGRVDDTTNTFFHFKLLQIMPYFVVSFTYVQLVPHGINTFLFLGKLPQLIPQSRWYGQTTDGNIMVLQNYGVCQRYLPRGGAELSRVATSLGSLVGWQVLLLQMLP